MFDIDNIFCILINVMFLVSVLGLLSYFYRRIKSYRTKYTSIKSIFLNRCAYSQRLIPKHYLVFQKFEVWRYCSLF